MLFRKVEVAEAAMLTRRDALTGGAENSVEWQSLEDALADVFALKRDASRNDNRHFALDRGRKRERVDILTSTKMMGGYFARPASILKVHAG